MYPLLNVGGDYLAVVNKDTKQVIDLISEYDIASGVFKNKIGDAMYCGEYKNLYGEPRSIVTGVEVVVPCTAKDVLAEIKDIYPDFVMDIAHMFIIPVGVKKHTFATKKSKKVNTTLSEMKL